MFRKVEQELGRKIPDALRKLSGGKWKWEPKIGEWWLDLDGKVHCIGDELYLEHIQSIKELAKAIPLLHWEWQLEPILEGMGYNLYMQPHAWKRRGKFFICRILTEQRYTASEASAKTRQEAVQRAVLALAEGKEK